MNTLVRKAEKPVLAYSTCCGNLQAFVSPVHMAVMYGAIQMYVETPPPAYFFKYMKGILKVKSSTNHVAVLGECGQLPPSVLCHINVLCFYNRLQNLDWKCIVIWWTPKISWNGF